MIAILLAACAESTLPDGCSWLVIPYCYAATSCCDQDECWLETLDGAVYGDCPGDGCEAWVEGECMSWAPDDPRLDPAYPG